ncbi:sugar kinase [Halomonas eurihalina]|uniref:Sugar kinase n=1 Tax=Halomonas eurihalina TaxID=42566 RepID=A0A5D9DCQ0_HALER|nr:sugar kinase [Halomonas eurihalina]MDR5858156.1 sugar kinase [Halomonas eurihalina]TZG41339.1 sugar kinase [Halomonas eurihalina]
MSKIMTIGEVLVEFIAAERGQPFNAPGQFLGPYPSGAPAIFIDQVGRLGKSCGMFGSVGDDGFGELNRERLKRDGVDIEHIRVLNNATTGSAFVTYHQDSSRDFIYNITNAACSQITPNQITRDSLSDCQILHVMGTSLFSFRVIEATQKAIRGVKANGGLVSFDPNIRKEMLGLPEMRDALNYILELTDILLPSEGELVTLLGTATEQQALDEVFRLGVNEVIVKLGSKGGRYHDRSGRHIDAPGFTVEECDPTGAGDCFGATYIALFGDDLSIEERLRYANAAGARAVTCMGPMEGASSMAELDEFIEQHAADIH